MHTENNIISVFVLSFASFVWAGAMGFALAGRYLRYKESKKMHTHGNWSSMPRALVILPCKGTDLTIETNMLSLRAQNYPDYDIIAVVDSKDDVAVDHIKAADLKYLIADKRFDKCSGKIKNILTAFEKYGRSDRYKVYVVVDADVTASPDWLSSLVRPLSDSRFGVSTTYPYFNPVCGTWSKIKNVWNFVGLGMMESERTRFVWGGSMAFRKELVTKELTRSMGTAVADDIEIHRACRRAGLGVYYVRKRIAFVNVRENFASFIEWANRQTALSLSADRKLIVYGKLIYGTDCLLILMGILLPFFYGAVWVFLLLPLAVRIAGSYSKMERKGMYVVPATLLVQFIYLYNIMKAARMENIQWRGIKYKIG